MVGKLNRKHVKAAMEKGISAYQVRLRGMGYADDQIISYLSSHAHPQMHLSVRRPLTCFVRLNR